MVLGFTPGDVDDPNWVGYKNFLIPRDLLMELLEITRSRRDEAKTPPYPSTAPTVTQKVEAAKLIDPVAQRIYARRGFRFQNAPPRPTSLDGIVAQLKQKWLMRSLLVTPSPCHLMLTGPAGVGKTTMARAIFDLAKQDEHSPFAADAPFVYVDGTKVFNDRYNNLCSLQTAVIESLYSGVKERNAKLNLAADTPEIRIGPFGQAHGGILFIDEFGELPHDTMTLLLTPLEEGVEKLPARAATGMWLTDDRTPKWMKEFVKNGVPASFILIAATTRKLSEIDPAIRSRCEVINFDELTSDDRREIGRRTAAHYSIEIDSKALDRLAATTTNGREMSRRVMVAAYAANRRGSLCIELEDILCPAIAVRTGFRP